MSISRDTRKTLTGGSILGEVTVIGSDTDGHVLDATIMTLDEMITATIPFLTACFRAAETDGDALVINIPATSQVDDQTVTVTLTITPNKPLPDEVKQVIREAYAPMLAHILGEHLQHHAAYIANATEKAFQASILKEIPEELKQLIKEHFELSDSDLETLLTEGSLTQRVS